MLCLTRRVGERVRIGPDIWVELLEVDYRNNRVKIGISAPDRVTILREELIDRGPRDEGRSES